MCSLLISNVVTSLFFILVSFHLFFFVFYFIFHSSALFNFISFPSCILLFPTWSPPLFFICLPFTINKIKKLRLWKKKVFLKTKLIKTICTKLIFFFLNALYAVKPMCQVLQHKAMFGLCVRNSLNIYSINCLFLINIITIRYWLEALVEL